MADEPVEEWMRKPKKGISNVTVSASVWVCARVFVWGFGCLFILLYFFKKQCNQSQTRPPVTAEQCGGGGGRPAYPIVRVTDGSHYDSTPACSALDVWRKGGLHVETKPKRIYRRTRDSLKGTAPQTVEAGRRLAQRDK